VGVNLAVMHDTFYRSRYRETLAAAAEDGLLVGRIWAFGEGPEDAEPWEREGRLFRAGPEGWLEESFRHLDRVLVEARQRGLRLIITLGNNWGDYGGIPMYLRWRGMDPDEWGAKQRFFTDERIKGWYRAHIERVVGRVNHITGVPYREDPTILAWELMNESTVFGKEAMEARRSWIVEMLRFVRRLDPNHLVSPGLLGYDTEEERDEWVRVMKLPEVSFCDIHFYPQDNPFRLGTARAIERAIDDAAALARFVVQKPLIIGEFGFRSHPPLWEGFRRDAWHESFVGRALDDGAAGVMAWVYEPWRGRERPYGIYYDNPRGTAVRKALASSARCQRSRTNEIQNSLLLGQEAPTGLFEPYVTVSQRKPSHTAWRPDDDGTMVLEIPPGAFAETRWSRVGTWEGGVLVHAYGAGSGYFEYRFEVLPKIQPAELRIRARLSSEYPGATSPPDGLSRVIVSLDGHPVAAFPALADDGIGRWYEVTVSDRQILANMGYGSHELRLEVRPGVMARGLAVYGPATGKGPILVSDGAPISVKLFPK